MRVWRGRKKGRTYFKIPRTFFKFSQTYFFFAPTYPFAHPATKTQKRVKNPERFSRPGKMNIHYFQACDVCRKTCRSHTFITHHAPGAEQVGRIATQGTAGMRQPATVSTPRIQGVRPHALRIRASASFLNPRLLPKHGSTLAVSSRRANRLLGKVGMLQA